MSRPDVDPRQFVLFGMPLGPQRYSNTVLPVWKVLGKTVVVGMSFEAAPKS